MANTVTADHAKAFDEAFALAGAVADIDGTSVNVIVSREFETEQSFNTEGTLDTVSEGEITAKTADIPAITISSVVTLETIAYRITSNNSEGKIFRTLELESP